MTARLFKFLFYAALSLTALGVVFIEAKRAYWDARVKRVCEAKYNEWV